MGAEEELLSKIIEETTPRSSTNFENKERNPSEIEIFRYILVLIPLHAILFPFLDPQLGSTQLGGLLSMEHIQDFAICARQFTARRLTLRLWPNVQLHLRALVESRPNAQGYLHWLEIRFAWFFVKLAGMKDAQITTQQILSIHQAAIEAAEAFNRTGSVKRNGNDSRDHRFISGQQVESFKIKPLLRALIIIIVKRIDRPFLNALQRM